MMIRLARCHLPAPLAAGFTRSAQGATGARVAGGEVHRGERAVVDAQGDLVVVKDVEHVEDVPGAAYEAEHL
jgi:hypothetical protein